MRKFLTFGWVFAAGLAVGSLVVGPLPAPDVAKWAILDEYVATYCEQPDRDHVERWIGNAEALSRTAIRADIGELVLAEYEHCKGTK